MTAGVWSDLVQIYLHGSPVWSLIGSNSGYLLQLGNPEIHRQQLLALRGKPGQKGKVYNDLLSISLIKAGKIRKINNDLRKRENAEEFHIEDFSITFPWLQIITNIRPKFHT